MSSGPAIIELCRPEDLTRELLDSLHWPAEAPKAAFRFKEAANEDSLSALSRLPGQYIVRIGYVALTSALSLPAASSPEREPGWRTPTNLEALKTLTRKTLIERFYEPWREYESPAFLKEVDAFLEHGLALNASAHYLLEGRAVGLLNLMAHQDCRGRPVDHIAWLWIDEGLAPAERANVHAGLLRRLALLPTGRIQGFVHTFNVRSRRFFAKLGFTPSCLHISKRP